MFDHLIAFSLRRRALVLLAALGLVVYGSWVVPRMPIDVFPDLNRPTVTVMTEAHGLSPEEVELLVTVPLEQALLGAAGVQRVRATSGVGLSVVAVEFGWESDVARARQTVAERLALARDQIPAGLVPAMGPVSSIMGEILLLGIESDSTMAPPELRRFADFTLRPRLLSVPGVSQVIAIGGGVEQVHVEADPPRMAALGVTLEDVANAVAGANAGSRGGALETQGREWLVRSMGRIQRPDDLLSAPVATRDGIPVPLSQVADVRMGIQPPRGSAGVDGRPAVILSVQKQPHQSTVALTREIEHLLSDLRPTLPAGVRVEPIFVQARFIEAAVLNVEHALRDGAILVVLVLLLFLLNWRTTLITLTAIPLSFLTALLVMRAMGANLDTMVLGGIAIAIGELVDDAIVDVENVFRRLRENRTSSSPRPPLQVVLSASREVRNAIVYSTLLVVLVFIPLFALGGIEGRLFRPLGIAYVVSILASFVVSLTVTPALCAWLLPSDRSRSAIDETRFVRFLKRVDRRWLTATLARPWPVFAVTAVLVAAAFAAVPFLGREFLPPFNEGTVTVSVVARPGISLTESTRLGSLAEQLLHQVPEVVTTGRRTGRAERDEHAEGVQNSEIEVDLRPSQRSRAEILADMRHRLAAIPGVSVGVGQPISHRLDHLLSGVRAQVAVKISGPDLAVLRAHAAEVAQIMAGVPGFVDLQVEAQTEVPQLRVTPDRAALARFGVTAETLSEAVETSVQGRTVTEWVDGQRRVDVVLRFDESARRDPEAMRATRVQTADGRSVPLAMLAHVETSTGPNQIVREDGERRMVVAANVAGRDLGGTVDELRRRLAREVRLPPGYAITLGGQFQSQEAATRWIAFLGTLSVLGMLAVLWSYFGSVALALQVLLNIPLALVGAVAALALTGSTLSVASLVGFITLTGIATRNTILMVSHYLHLMREDGLPFGPDLVVRGSLERLVPVLMTAGTAMLALVPLAWAPGVPGKEVLHPVAVVILGGLVSSTLLDMLVTPAVFLRFGRAAAEGHVRRTSQVGEEAVR